MLPRSQRWKKKNTIIKLRETETMNSPPSKTLDTESEGGSVMETNSLLTEGAFCSERSQKLFEAIDELQSCGANRDIDLPEVSRFGTYHLDFA